MKTGQQPDNRPQLYRQALQKCSTARLAEHDQAVRQFVAYMRHRDVHLEQFAARLDAGHEALQRLALSHLPGERRDNRVPMAVVQYT